MNKTQIALISGSVLLIVLLLFANTKLPKTEVKAEMSGHAGKGSAGISAIVDEAVNSLDAAQKQTFEKQKEALKTSTDKKAVFESIVGQWDSLRKPAVAAFYAEQEAIALPMEKTWSDAGNRYYAAGRFAKEGLEKRMLFGKAIECFEKTVEINPENVEAQISLGASYVEGSSDPMKGIGILRDIEKTSDSNNVNLQLNFAFFSEKSGQWDKAISRFSKVLRIKPDFIEAYLHLADAYEQKGDKAKAVETLEKYLTLVKDDAVKTEVQNYINKIKN